MDHQQEHLIIVTGVALTDPPHFEAIDDASGHMLDLKQPLNGPTGSRASSNMPFQSRALFSAHMALIHSAASGEATA